jgi:hypothetical protein
VGVFGSRRERLASEVLVRGRRMQVDQMTNAPRTWNRTPTRVTFRPETSVPEAKKPQGKVESVVAYVGLPAFIVFLLACLVSLYLVGSWRVVTKGERVTEERDGGVVVERPAITSGDPE